MKSDDISACEALDRVASAGLHFQEQLQGARSSPAFHLNRGENHNWIGGEEYNNVYDDDEYLKFKTFLLQVLIFSSLTFVFEKEATESGEMKLKHKTNNKNLFHNLFLI